MSLSQCSPAALPVWAVACLISTLIRSFYQCPDESIIRGKGRVFVSVVAERREARLSSRPNPWATFGLASVAQFMVVLDASIINVALPSIQRGLSFSFQDLQWVVN